MKSTKIVIITFIFVVFLSSFNVLAVNEDFNAYANNNNNNQVTIGSKDYIIVDSLTEFEELMLSRALAYEEYSYVLIDIPYTNENKIELNNLLKNFKIDIAANDAYLAFIYSGRSWSISSTMYNGQASFLIELRFNFSDYYKNQAEDEKRIKEILLKIINDKMYTHEKLKVIHDYIVNNYQYDTDYDNYYIKDMLDEGKGVCQAYSLLTYKMLKLSNIPVKYIVGEGYNGSSYGSHAWNMVNLGGYWFNLDVTWDDPLPDVKGRVLYDYYMINDEELKKDHIPSNEYTYPVANKSYKEYINDFNLNEAAIIRDKTTDGINIKIRDSYVDFTNTGQTPVIVSGRTLVPIRAVFENLGYDVSYDSKTFTATVSDGKSVVEIVSNKDFALINGVEKKLDVSAKVLNNRILVPVRFISEAFGNIVLWDDVNKVVIIH